jgi:hypothetical protein
MLMAMRRFSSGGLRQLPWRPVPSPDDEQQNIYAPCAAANPTEPRSRLAGVSI